MKDKLDTDRGRAIYSKRIGTVEPVFAHIRYAGQPHLEKTAKLILWERRLAAI